MSLKFSVKFYCNKKIELTLNISIFNSEQQDTAFTKKRCSFRINLFICGYRERGKRNRLFRLNNDLEKYLNDRKRKYNTWLWTKKITTENVIRN